MMARARRICIVTGSRAEYGLLRWLMHEIKSDPALELHVVVTGMHLSPAFGLTVRDIEADGMPISARIDIVSTADDRKSTAHSVGRGVEAFADAFDSIRPDIVVVLGDRFEIFAAAQAAAFLGIPLAHLCGGEITAGAIDDWMRHAISKMAWWHFAEAEPYRRRLIQLGEDPTRVFTVGAPGLDSIRCLPMLDRNRLAADLGVALGSPLFLVTYHPATQGVLPPDVAFSELLRALDRFPEATVIVTGANADAGGRRLAQMADEWSAGRPGSARCFSSLGQLRYLSLMRLADAVIGNSSSGIIEAPALKVATVNIGPRQYGRLMATSVISCAEDCSAIEAALRRTLAPDFRAMLPKTVSPYGGDNVAVRIKAILATAPLPASLAKTFHDL